MRTAVSLFAGIGGFDLGLERAGFHVIAQVEIDPFCQRVLAARWPGVTRFSDVRTVEAAAITGEVAHGSEEVACREGVRPMEAARVDLLVGGFP